jgi:O-antigen/teichoic acid export membrane protein
MPNHTVNLKAVVLSSCPEILRRYWSQVESSPLGFRLAKGVFWSLAGALISRGIALLASILVARVLGKEGFGELGIIQSTVGMFGVFAGFGLGMTATKHVAEFRVKDPKKAGRIIALSNLVAIISGGVMSVILIILAPRLSSQTLAAPHLSEYLQIGAGLLFLSALNGVQTGALSGFEAFKTIAKVNLWAGIANFPLMVGGVYFAGIKGAVWGLVASMFVNWVLNHITIKNEAYRVGVHITYNHCLQEWGILWKFSFPAALAGIMVGPVNWVCNAMLVNQPNGYAEMGIYNAANQWFIALLFLPGIIGQIVLPMLSERLGEKDKESSKAVLMLSIKLNCLIVLPLVIGGCLASPFIMQLYGDGFREEWLTLVVVLVTAGLLAVQTPVGHIIAASGRMWVGLVMNMAWGLFFWPLQ